MAEEIKMREEAKRIARDLLRSLKAGEISKIGIEEVRSAITANGIREDETFEKMVLLSIIGEVG
jgi:hypothetical protein